MPKKDMLIDIKSITPSKQDVYLLDTNILIKILYPVGFGGNIQNYEKFYLDMREQNAKMIVTSVQLSEFINRCIRFQFQLYKEEHLNVKDFKKDYRITDSYRNSMQSILEIVENDIVPYFQFVSDKFETINKSSIFRYGFSYDFNDALLVEIAKKYEAIIVTDDGDFSNYVKDISIVTGNAKLLNLARMMS